MCVQTVSSGEQSIVAEEEIASKVAHWAAGCVVFADRASLSAVVRRLERSESVADRLRGRSIAYLCRLPLNGNTPSSPTLWPPRYVAPEPKPTLGTWRTSLGIDRQLPTLQAIGELAKTAASGEVPVTPTAPRVLAESGKGIYGDLSAGAPAVVRTFKAINNHVDLWSAVERTDALLRQNALGSGDTVEAVPFKMLGGIVECTVSTRFKLRPGSEVLVWQDDAAGIRYPNRN